jgi:hypothetical protein
MQGFNGHYLLRDVAVHYRVSDFVAKKLCDRLQIGQRVGRHVVVAATDIHLFETGMRVLGYRVPPPVEAVVETGEITSS